MKYGNINARGLVKPAWQEVYKTATVGTATNLTISGLSGDTDVMYQLTTKFENGAVATAYYGTRLNNDSGANYGIQYLGAADTVLDPLSSAVYTELYTDYSGAGKTSYGKMFIYAKSGFLRLAQNSHLQSVIGTTINDTYMMAMSWNNTADNITSLFIYSSAAGGIGDGSYICLERLNL